MLRIKTWVVAYSKFEIIFLRIFKKKFNLILCNFLVRLQKCFLKTFPLFFCSQKVEKNTLKSCSEKLKSTFFFFTALTAQTAQTEEFVFPNVA